MFKAINLSKTKSVLNWLKPNTPSKVSILILTILALAGLVVYPAAKSFASGSITHTQSQIEWGGDPADVAGIQRFNSAAVVSDCSSSKRGCVAVWDLKGTRVLGDWDSPVIKQYFSYVKSDFEISSIYIPKPKACAMVRGVKPGSKLVIELFDANNTAYNREATWSNIPATTNYQTYCMNDGILLAKRTQPYTMRVVVHNASDPLGPATELYVYSVSLSY